MKYSLRSLTTFSIRELLMVMAIIGLSLGWGLERVKVVRENQLLREILQDEHQRAFELGRAVDSYRSDVERLELEIRELKRLRDPQVSVPNPSKK